MSKISASENIDNIQVKEQESAPATPGEGYGRIYCKSDGLYFIGNDGEEIGPLAAASSSGGYTEGARVYNDADISVANATDVALTFNSERYDTDTIHDVSSNTGRLTCKTAGKYIIVANIQFNTHATGLRHVWFRINGTTEIARVSDTPGVAIDWRMCLTTIYDLSINDYVEVGVYQNSGGALTVEASANRSPEFMMQRIG